LACWKEEIGEDFTETFTVTTGDGVHFYFSVSDRLRTGTGVLGRGLDVKGFDNYVVAPGSTHSSGTTYIVTNDSPIAPMPELMFNNLLDRRLRHSVPVGERHHFLMRCARRLAGEGLESNQIYDVLFERLTSFCEQGGRQITDDELLRLAEWARGAASMRENSIQIA